MNKHMYTKTWERQIIILGKSFMIPEDIVEGIIQKVENDNIPPARWYGHKVAACKYDRALRLLRPYM